MPCKCLEEKLAKEQKSRDGLSTVKLFGHCRIWNGRIMYNRGQQAFMVTPIEDPEWDEVMDGVKPVEHLEYWLGRYCQFCGEKYPTEPGLDWD